MQGGTYWLGSRPIKGPPRRKFAASVKFFQVPARLLAERGRRDDADHDRRQDPRAGRGRVRRERPCAVNGTTLHIGGAGTCTVTASQTGDANFNAAPPVSQSFAIAKASHTIDFEPLAYVTLGRDFHSGSRVHPTLVVGRPEPELQVFQQYVNRPVGLLNVSEAV